MKRMSYCPVCTSQLSGLCCAVCGYEESKDYLKYRSLGAIDPAIKPAAVIRKERDAAMVEQQLQGMLEKLREEYKLEIRKEIDALRAEFESRLRKQEPGNKASEKDTVSKKDTVSEKGTVPEKNTAKKSASGMSGAGKNLWNTNPELTQSRSYAKKERFIEPEVHDIVRFGTEKRKNEWIVLEKKDHQVLLLARDLHARMPFHIAGGEISWEDSSVRKWLNTTFLNHSFSEEEQHAIVKRLVPNYKNVSYGTSSGAHTEDHVFLLSVEEANKYLEEQKSRIASFIGETEPGWWLLRTAGVTRNRTAIVNNDGSINMIGSFTDSRKNGVRPALWVNLNRAVPEIIQKYV